MREEELSQTVFPEMYTRELWLVSLDEDVGDVFFEQLNRNIGTITIIRICIFMKDPI
jgi:hypothetical protein